MSGRTTGDAAPLEVRTISVGSRLVALKQTIVAECIVRRRKAGRTVMFRFRPLKLRGKGTTRSEAAADFDRGLQDLLESLRDEPVEPQGVELQRRLAEYVDGEELEAIAHGR